MTSKHLFFKSMREDLRHRTWMLALSLLGNFLATLVVFLLATDHYEVQRMIEESQKISWIGGILRFFSETVIVSGGCIALVGALIVGLWGFRFLHSKKMVDTYHSMPIKRNTQFWVTYLNGFLIWFIPYLICMLVTVIMGIIKLIDLQAVDMIPTLLKNAGTSTMLLLLGFLLVYHVVLVAVMLSGNILNTLVITAVLGVAGICIYGLTNVFFEYYMDTFYGTGAGIELALYCSPIASAIGVLSISGISEDILIAVRFYNINFAIMLVLGAVAWKLYCNRASELAEQGTKHKTIARILQLGTSIVGGMGGFLVFELITGRNAVVWGIFGCILVSVMAFGIMDIIFHMDFKAFFANKFWMLGCTVGAILLCLCIKLDWIGYDTYLPKQEKIASFAMYTYNYSACDNGEQMLDRMKIQDREAIYAFLERMTEKEDDGAGTEETGKGVTITELVGEPESSSSYYYSYYYDEYNGSSEFINVKVTLKNGRSYYRQYQVGKEDADVFLPLLLSPEYVQAAYLFEEETEDGIHRIDIRNEDYTYVHEERDAELIRDLMEAYRKDVEKNPAGIIQGEGRLLAQIRCHEERYYHRYVIDVYEGMEHTVAALKKHGYADAVTPINPADVEMITLDAGEDYITYEYGGAIEPDYELMARERFGVWDDESRERVKKQEEKIEEYWDAQTEKTYSYKDTIAEAPSGIKLDITDPAEIAELLELIHYEDVYENGMFKRRLCRGIQIQLNQDNKDEIRTGFIEYGKLPEKYIKRFAQVEPVPAEE